VEESRKNFWQPIFLEDVSVRDMEAFLTVLYYKLVFSPLLPERSYTVNRPLNPLPDFKKEDWISILKLSHRWGFSTFYAATIPKLEPLLSAVDKIVLARTYDVWPWLQPAFEEVCSQASWLSDGDCRRIGFEDIMKIAREILRSGVCIIEDKGQQAEVVEEIIKLGSTGCDNSVGPHDLVDEPMME
jgi:hypothetical protein